MLTRLVTCLFITTIMFHSEISEPNQVIETSGEIFEQEEIIEEPIIIEEEKELDFEKPITKLLFSKKIPPCFWKCSLFSILFILPPVCNNFADDF